MKKFDIVALGEVLIDYTPMKESENGMQVFEQNAGGAPANVSACGAKLGAKVAFIGKVGNDMQGEFLRNTLVDVGVETKGLISDEEHFTTLAFVTLNEAGDRGFTFSRKHSADIHLSKEEIDTSLLRNTQIFHFGSISMTHEKCRKATLFALEEARKNNAMISYDPNYRPTLWESEEVASAAIQSVLNQVDILKISSEETYLLTEENDPEKAMEILLNREIPIVAITLGSDGTLIANHEGLIKVQGKKVAEVIDTTGAGDTFWGAFLYKIAKSNKTLSELTLGDLEEYAKFANGAASICVTKRGAIASMPTLEQIYKS